MKTARLSLTIDLKKKLEKGSTIPTIGTVRIEFESGAEKTVDFLDEEIDINGKSVNYLLLNIDTDTSAPDACEYLLKEKIEQISELYISRGDFNTVIGVADVCFEVYDDANDRFVNVPVRRDKINVYVGD